jgi:hypothetical protein
MNFLKNNWFKIIAIAILLGALGSHPYSYYQILRWFITICSGYLAYNYFSLEKTNWAWVFTTLSILFNPIFPIYFTKSTWALFDLAGAVIFSISLFINNKH